MRDDRRKTERVNGPFDGSWDGASGRRHSRISDISLGGAYVEARGAMPLQGERVMIEAQIGARRVRLASEVVYLDRITGFGVRFVDNAPEALEALAVAIREFTGR